MTKQFLLASTAMFAAAVAARPLFPTPVSAQHIVVHNGEVPAHPGCKINLTENLRLGDHRSPAEQRFHRLLHFAIAPDGSIYVLDSDSSGISIFSPNGTFVRTIGVDADLKKPYRIAATTTRMFVYDRDPARILVFSPAGVLINSANPPFFSAAQPFLAPDSTGGLYLALAPFNGDPARSVVHYFDSRLQLAHSFGTVNIPDSTDFRLLASGPVTLGANGKLWFAPMSAYQLRRYRANGEIELTVTRENQFAYLPRPYQQTKLLGGGRGQVSFDNERAFTTNLGVDPDGNVWYFTRDFPGKRTVIDVFSPAGAYLYNYEFPLTDAPSRLDASGQLYAVTADGAYSQIIRYRVHRTCN